LECYGVSVYDRESGTLDEYIDPSPKTITQIVPPIKTIPCCFVGKADLRAEAAELFDDNVEELRKDSGRIRRVITTKRNCPAWYIWRDFASPKEQWEESMMLALDKKRETFEQQMEKDRKEFELKLYELGEQARKRDKKIFVILAIAAVIFAALEVLAALLD